MKKLVKSVQELVKVDIFDLIEDLSNNELMVVFDKIVDDIFYDPDIFARKFMNILKKHGVPLNKKYNYVESKGSWEWR